jgi:DNA-binding beta-propeller fold protein YncE
MVVDVDTIQAVGEVAGLEGAHGIALVKEEGIGFATSGKSGEVFVFDLKDLKVVRKIPSGENPDAIVYEPSTKRIFAFNGKSKDITAIDLKTLKVVGKIVLDGKPEFSAVDGKGKIFFNLEDKSQLLSLDPQALTILSRWDLKPCEEPTGLSIDAATERLIVGCGNEIAVIVDAQNGKVVQTFAVGSGVDATAFDPQRKLAWISAGDGILTQLSEDASGFKKIKDLPTVKGARTLAVDTKTGRVFLPFADFKPLPAGQKTVGHLRPEVVPGSFGVIVVGK